MVYSGRGRWHVISVQIIIVNSYSNYIEHLFVLIVSSITCEVESRVSIVCDANLHILNNLFPLCQVTDYK